jgi:hypothetical protein
MNLGKPDAGGRIFALAHRNNLLSFKLHYRVPAPAARRSDDAEQLNRNPSRRGNTLVGLHPPEQKAG